MDTISTKELRRILDNGEPVTLIMAMGEVAFSMGHIPGSISVTGPDGLDAFDDLEVPIVGYCTGPDCAASGIAYRQMIAAGYTDVRHFAGGLAAWEAEGFPIETGTMIKDRSAVQASEARRKLTECQNRGVSALFKFPRSRREIGFGTCRPSALPIALAI